MMKSHSLRLGKKLTEFCKIKNYFNLLFIKEQPENFFSAADPGWHNEYHFLKINQCLCSRGTFLPIIKFFILLAL